MKKILKDNLTGKEACYKTILKISKGHKYINFKFISFNSTFNSFSEKYNDPLYKGDVCEIFIRFGKDNHYYEIEVAPNGTIFLADILNVNNQISSQLIDECFIKATSKIFKNKYIVKVKIPRNKILTKNLEFNAFRIETDGEKSEKYLFALHPTMCNSFHKSESIF